MVTSILILLLSISALIQTILLRLQRKRMDALTRELRTWEAAHTNLHNMVTEFLRSRFGNSAGRSAALPDLMRYPNVVESPSQSAHATAGNKDGCQTGPAASADHDAADNDKNRD